MNAPITSELLKAEPDTADLVKQFIQSLPSMMEQIQHAAKNKNWEEMADVAHDLKGSSGNYGYPSVVNMAKLIEFNLSQGQTDFAVYLLKDLESLIERVQQGAENL